MWETTFKLASKIFYKNQGHLIQGRDSDINNNL